MAMVAVTEEKEEGEEERKSEESNNSDNLVGFISHATDQASDWPGGESAGPGALLLAAAETTLKIKTQRSKEARVEHRDARLPSRYVSRSRGFSQLEKGCGVYQEVVLHKF